VLVMGSHSLLDWVSDGRNAAFWLLRGHARRRPPVRSYTRPKRRSLPRANWTDPSTDNYSIHLAAHQPRRQHTSVPPADCGSRWLGRMERKSGRDRPAGLVDDPVARVRKSMPRLWPCAVCTIPTPQPPYAAHNHANTQLSPPHHHSPQIASPGGLDRHGPPSSGRSSGRTTDWPTGRQWIYRTAWENESENRPGSPHSRPQGSVDAWRG